MAEITITEKEYLKRLRLITEAEIMALKEMIAEDRQKIVTKEKELELIDGLITKADYFE